MCFAITLLESNKIIAQTKVIMFNKKNNSLPNFLHVFLGIWLQVVWGGAVHHPGLRGRRRVKTEGVKLRGVVDTIPYPSLCNMSPLPTPPFFVPLRPWACGRKPNLRERVHRARSEWGCVRSCQRPRGGSHGGKGSRQTWCVRGGVVSW